MYYFDESSYGLLEKTISAVLRSDIVYDFWVSFLPSAEGRNKSGTMPKIHPKKTPVARPIFTAKTVERRANSSGDRLGCGKPSLRVVVSTNCALPT